MTVDDVLEQINGRIDDLEEETPSNIYAAAATVSKLIELRGILQYITEFKRQEAQTLWERPSGGSLTSDTSRYTLMNVADGHVDE